MSEVLVTGANGFVGSHICEALLASGFEVRALVRKTSQLENLKGLNIQLCHGDLNDSASLAGAVEGVEAVINNGGLTKTLRPQEFQLVNAIGTENVLRITLEKNPAIQRFVQISSTAACGPAPDQKPINEDHPPHPLTAYGRSKLEGERAVLKYRDQLPCTILRPSAVYGPRDKEMLSFFKAVKLGIKPTFGQGESYINFTYVKDLARAVVMAIQTATPSGGIYFVAEKTHYAYSRAGDIISGVLGNRALDIHVPESIMSIAGRITEEVSRWRGKASIFTEDKAREICRKYWIYDASKIERDFGFAATDFKSGVQETVAWYKEKGWL